MHVLFAPSPTAPFQFNPTLDGNQYLATVTWSYFGRRWILNIYDLNGSLVLTIPLIGSPSGYDINLVQGYFSSSIVFRESSNQFEVTP